MPAFLVSTPQRPLVHPLLISLLKCWQLLGFYPGLYCLPHDGYATASHMDISCLVILLYLIVHLPIGHFHLEIYSHLKLTYAPS